LLEDAGFERVEVYPLWNRYPVRYWMRLFPFPSGLKNRLLSLAEASRVGGIQISMPAGNLVLSGFKP
jgi:hypothetical protein